MGFGTGPFGITSFGTPADPLEGENPSDLSSSRKIDGVTKRYVVNDRGGFESMDDTDQRVLLLVSFNSKEIKLITPTELKKEEDSVRRALEQLTTGRVPAIKLLRVAVERSAPGTTRRTVEYKNLLTGTKQTVSA